MSIRSNDLMASRSVAAVAGDTATSLFNRIKVTAPPVSLADINELNWLIDGRRDAVSNPQGERRSTNIPPNLAGGGGLRARESIVLAGPTSSGKTEWSYRIAAMHLCRGGSVIWVAAGYTTFDPIRFMCILESSICAVYRMRYSTVVESVFGGAKGFEEGLMGLARNLTFLNCPTIPELVGTLLNLDPAQFTAAPGSAALKAFSPQGNTSSTSSSSTPTPTPLLVVDGLGIPLGTHLLEKQLSAPFIIGSAIDDCLMRLSCAGVVNVCTWGLSGREGGGNNNNNNSNGRGDSSGAVLSQLSQWNSSLPLLSLRAVCLLSSYLRSAGGPQPVQTEEELAETTPTEPESEMEFLNRVGILNGFPVDIARTATNMRLALPPSSSSSTAIESTGWEQWMCSLPYSITDDGVHVEIRSI
jgi:hypothetical protein